MAKRMRCPKCKSSNIQIMGKGRGKSFSMGKAAVGGFLVPGIGLLAGTTGKKGKYEVFCMDCGHRWKTK